MNDEDCVIRDVVYDVFSHGSCLVDVNRELKLFRKEGVTDPSKGFYASEYPYTPLGRKDSGWKCIDFQKARYHIWEPNTSLYRLLVINYLAEDICKRYLSTLPDSVGTYYHYVKDIISVGLLASSDTVIELGWDTEIGHDPEKVKCIFRELHRMGVVVYLVGCRGEDGKARPRAYTIHPCMENELNTSLSLLLGGGKSLEDVVLRKINLPPFLRGYKSIQI